MERTVTIEVGKDAGREGAGGEGGVFKRPEGERGGLIAGAAAELAELATSGELAERVSRPNEAERVMLDPDEYPELEGVAVGSPVVLVIAGVVTKVPKPREEREQKDGAPPPIYFDKIEVAQTETAVVVTGEAPGAAEAGRVDSLRQARAKREGDKGTGAASAEAGS